MSQQFSIYYIGRYAWRCFSGCLLRLCCATMVMLCHCLIAKLRKLSPLQSYSKLFILKVYLLPICWDSTSFTTFQVDTASGALFTTGKQKARANGILARFANWDQEVRTDDSHGIPSQYLNVPYRRYGTVHLSTDSVLLTESVYLEASTEDSGRNCRPDPCRFVVRPAGRGHITV
jgi:hypothetical protein